MTSLKLWESLKFMVKHSYRDTKRRKCHYCLAFGSVFIVVLFTLVINTIVAKGPIIFLKMAEASEGEIDGHVTPSVSSSGSEQSYFVNYTRVYELYGDQYNLSPRKSYCSVPFGSDYNNPAVDYDPNPESEGSIQGGGTGALEEWQSGFDPSTDLPSRNQILSTSIGLPYSVCL